MTGVVVCSGTINNYVGLKKYFEGAELVICADGGAAHLRKFGILPDILAGDLDSILPEDYKYLLDAGVKIVKYPVEKDMTDTELAIRLAVEKGCRSVILLGALGSRLDHSLANLFLLRSLLEMGIKCTIANENNEVVLINSSINLKREEGVKITLLPLTGKVTGVTTSGLYYPLVNATIELGSSLGVSNEFAEDEASVSIEDGLLLVIKSRD